MAEGQFSQLGRSHTVAARGACCRPVLTSGGVGTDFRIIHRWDYRGTRRTQRQSGPVRQQNEPLQLAEW